MGLFKEIMCVECGAKTGLLSRTKIDGEQYLCSKCTSSVPSYIKKYLGEYSHENFKNLLFYLQTTNPELEKKFKQTHSFYGIHLDAVNGIFCFDTGLFSKSIYLELESLADFDLVYKAEEFKEGMLSDKVIGEICFGVKMMHPYFCYEDVIATGVKAGAKQSFFGTKVTYSNPKGMDEFIQTFEEAWAKAREEWFALLEEYRNKYEAEESELKQAMALFMLDDLDGVTLEQLEKHKNRMLSAFDMESENDKKFAQKIEEAYVVLTSNVKM